MPKIDKQLVLKRITEIRDTVDFLKEILDKAFNELNKTEILSIRYSIIQLVEAAATICLHIMHTVYGFYPESYPSCFLIMHEKGWIPKNLGNKLATVSRLRNLLVHRYWEIDDERVYRETKEGLKDFLEFVEIVEERIKE